MTDIIPPESVPPEPAIFDPAQAALTAAEREEFFRAYPVSHETAEKFDRYAAMLIDWQTRMNLVAPSTLPQVWKRHFLDSAQLLAHIPQPIAGNAPTLVDVGSGAGFPGMVLALLGVKNVHLIEATQKKAFFLRTVAATLGVEVTIIDQRAETIKDLRAEVITARALASLPELLMYAARFKRADSVLLFLKGAKAEEELALARHSWRFDVETVKSISDDSGNVLILRQVRHINEVNHARKNARRTR